MWNRRFRLFFAQASRPTNASENEVGQIPDLPSLAHEIIPLRTA